MRPPSKKFAEGITRAAYLESSTDPKSWPGSGSAIATPRAAGNAIRCGRRQSAAAIQGGGAPTSAASDRSARRLKCRIQND